jgi:hypothetical protein
MAERPTLRRKQTAYLTDDLVQALDHAYYQRRVTEPISKQEFFEQLLWRALRLRDGSRAALASLSPPSELASPVAGPTSPPPASPPATAEPTRKPPPTPGRRRPTALERLRAQAQPGRPSAIRSAADPE